MSYNLRKHAATSELRELVEAYPSDVLCLQEGDGVRMPSEIGDLTLASATYNSALGLSIYYRADRFTALDSHAFTLQRSVHDRVLQPRIERLLTTRFVDLQSGHDVQLASFHASPLSATNLTRRVQIRQAFAHLEGLADGAPVLMAGDFNYPVLRGALVKLVERAGYSLSLSDGPTYYYTNSIAYHFDFLTSKGFDVQLVETLPKGLSDHRPILVTAELLDRGGRRAESASSQAQAPDASPQHPADGILDGVDSQ